MKTILFSLAIMVVCASNAYSQTTIRGNVSDAKGQPLQGATVTIKGSARGAITDAKGVFQISTKAGEVLDFSYLGMLTQHIAVGARTVIDVVMKDDVAQLDEVVVVGYGTQQKASLTGSVSQIKGEALLKSPSTNVSSMLGGRLAGLSSVQESGQPGADQAALRIRGSKYAATYIVDGIPRSINDIDPNDVESVSVLKDASAAAVYGLSAAGGVIIVTTKKGTAGDSKITYKGSVGVSTNANFPEFLDGPGYAYYYNKAMVMDGKEPVFKLSHVKDMATNSNGWGNTNWIDATFGTGHNQQHSVTAQGGTDKIKYFTSLGYLDQSGNIKNFNYKRYSLRGNIEANIANNLTLTVGIAGQVGDQRTPGFAAGGGMNTGVPEDAVSWMSIAEQAILAHPYIPMEYDGLPTATADDYGNPVNPIAAAALSGQHKQGTTELQTNVTLRWDLPWVKGLNLKFTGGFDRGFAVTKNFNTPYALMLASNLDTNTSDIKYHKVTDVRGQVDSDLGEGLSHSTNLIAQSSINYAYTFSKHSIDAMALMEIRDYKNNRFSAYGKGYSFSELPELDLSRVPADKPIGGISDARRSVGFVGRVKYDYDNRYLAEFSGRYDGSYKFAGNANKRWGFFPSLSVGWRISNEEFFKNALSVVDNLKIRASVGSMGADTVDPFMFLSTLKYANNPIIINGLQQNALMTSSVSNMNLTWERTLSYNAGIDLSMWRGLLGVELDVFYNYTYDILTSQSNYPGSMGGYYMSVINNNRIDTKGIELMLTHDNRVGNFHYGARFNLSWSRNRYLTYPDAPNTPDYAKRVGKPINIGPGLVADGLFQSEDEINNSPYIVGTRPRPGDIKYVDLNGDGVISYTQDRAYVGRSNVPELTGGLNLFGDWKGIDFNVLFTGAAICDVSLTATYYNWSDDNTVFTETFKDGANSPRYLAENAWRPDNTSGTYPRLTVNAPNNTNGYASSFWFRDGKYLRLKSAQIGYTLPHRWLKTLKIDNVRVFAEGSNLFTWSGLPQGIDPESPGVNNGYYPQQRTFMGGLTITF